MNKRRERGESKFFSLVSSIHLDVACRSVCCHLIYRNKGTVQINLVFQSHLFLFYWLMFCILVLCSKWLESCTCIETFWAILRDLYGKQLTFVGWPLLTRSSASWPACQSWGLSWSLTWNNLSSSDRLKTFGHFSSQTGVGTALACIGSHTATGSASSFCLTAHTFPPPTPPLWSLAISKLRAT